MMRFLIPAMSVALMLTSSADAANISRDELAALKPVRAQQIVDMVIADNPDMLDVLLHVTPPGTQRNLVVASHIPANLGEISGADDLGVAATGKPVVEVQKDGVRIGILLQLLDAKHRSIGAIGLMFPWHAGDSQAAFLKRAKKIRNSIATQIPSQEALFG